MDRSGIYVESLGLLQILGKPLENKSKWLHHMYLGVGEYSRIKTS